MENRKQITVIGATGNLGAPVVKNLTRIGYSVKVIARNIEKADQLFGDNKNIETVYADLTDTRSLKAALKETSHLYLNLSTHASNKNVSFAPEREGIANILASLDSQAIRQIILISGLGALDNVQPTEGFEFIPNTIRKQGHRLIKESGIPYTILHCSWFLDSFLLYRRKGVYTVIGNNESSIFFTNCYDLANNIKNAINNKDAMYREFPVQGKEGFIHSEAANKLLAIMTGKPEVKIIPSAILKVMSYISKEMKFVSHMDEYSKRTSESHIADEYGTYKILGEPVYSLEQYAHMLKKDRFYSHLEK